MQHSAPFCKFLFLYTYLQQVKYFQCKHKVNLKAKESAPEHQGSSVCEVQFSIMYVNHSFQKQQTGALTLGVI